MKDTGRVAATLQRLRELGVKVLIDDERDAAIVSAIIGIAKSLSISVLAEGVNSPSHVQRLLSLGCDRGQGFFLHEPVQAPQCALLLAREDHGQSLLEEKSA